MSRAYNMIIEVREVPKDKIASVKEAIKEYWDFEDSDCYVSKKSPYLVQVNSDGALYGGRTEEEFAELIKESIWDTTKKYVEILIYATYLEDLPFETYSFEQDDYKFYLKEKRKEKD